MPLLTQNPAAVEQNATATQRDPLAGVADQDASALPADTGQQGLSFSTEQLVDSFKQNMDEEQSKDMGLIIDEGKQLMFGPESHSQIMGMLEGSQNIGQDLGNGAFDAMSLILKSMSEEKPNEEIDGKSILPAGVALISLALEFVNEAGMAPVTDDTFEEATHIFSTRMMDTYDPEFKQRAAQYGGAQQSTAQAQPVTGGV